MQQVLLFFVFFSVSTVLQARELTLDNHSQDGVNELATAQPGEPGELAFGLSSVFSSFVKADGRLLMSPSIAYTPAKGPFLTDMELGVSFPVKHSNQKTSTNPLLLTWVQRWLTFPALGLSFGTELEGSFTGSDEQDMLATTAVLSKSFESYIGYLNLFINNIEMTEVERENLGLRLGVKRALNFSTSLILNVSRHYRKNKPDRSLVELSMDHALNEKWTLGAGVSARIKEIPEERRWSTGIMIEYSP